MIRIIKSKDFINFLDYCSQRDTYSDFYITRDNKRLFLNNLKVAKNVFFNCLKHSDKCLIYEENDSIQGIIFITGFTDKFHRKYLKILTNNQNDTFNLIRALNWHYNCDLYVKIKKYNPAIEVLLGTKNYNWYLKKELDEDRFRGFGFKFQGSRGKEILLFRKFQKRTNNEPNK